MIEKKRRTVIERIHRSLSRNSTSTVAYMLDKITKYRLNGIHEAVEDLVKLAKEGKVKIYETKDGFKYKAIKKDGTDQEETTES